MRGLTLRLLHAPPLDGLAAALDAAQTAGADTICLVPHEYVLLGAHNAIVAPPWAPCRLIWRDEGQMPGGVGNSTPLSVVEAIARLVRARGLALWLKPHIDPGYLHDGVWGVGGWRFYASVKDVYNTPPQYEDETTAWMLAYDDFLHPYADLAARLGAGLVLGCELGSITREAGAAFWANLAGWVRADGFTGPLTYAANWGGECEDLDALWAAPAITHVGCDWYVPADQWAARAAALRAQAARVGKPLLFTEAGAANYAGCVDEPGADPPPGASPDNSAQLAWWQHFVATWPDVDRLAWEGPLVGLPQPGVSHQLLGRPAAAVALGPG